ncbi:MAG: hypothetical protein HGA42_15525 [Nostocales cyanobacterium W4_Combined_metabat2_030]|nr:hypothetical protein [Nostocales cyanobacterium W4_Combined_metabat2_030]
MIMRQDLQHHVFWRYNAKEYPFLYRFIIQASMETNPELVEKIAEINMQFGAQAFPQLFEKMDASKFKEGTDIQEISKMINWCSEAIWNQGLKTHASADDLFAEYPDLKLV